MSIFIAPGPSLATASPGRSFQVRRIHFGLVRDRCAELGIREGDVLRCLQTTPREVVVHSGERGTAALELHYARFVEVADPAPSSIGPYREEAAPRRRKHA